MTKPKTKSKAVTRSTTRRTGKPASRKRSAPASSKAAAGPHTKHDRIIAMLRTPAGATIASLVTATKWQQHSVRGFLAGVVRKKLGLMSQLGQTAHMAQRPRHVRSCTDKGVGILSSEEFATKKAELLSRL